MKDILDNYQQLLATITHAAVTAGQPIPQLMAVAKNQTAETLEILLKAGHRLFGENRVQEAHAKWPGLKTRYPDCQLHFIGSLQTNKVKQAVLLFDMIETLDRPSLARALAKAFSQLNVKRPLLIQVNTGREAQKSGVFPEDFSSFFKLCQSLRLPVKGLMCVPPAGKDPEPHFSYLKNLAIQHQLPYLSMGMSHDYLMAINYRSSWIRVGTALFG